MSDNIEIDDAEEELRSTPVSLYEVLQLVQPLRGALQDLIVSYMDIAGELASSSEGPSKEAFIKGFEKLEPCFNGIGDFDLKVQRLLNGLDINDTSVDVPMEDNIDE